ncbi:MAG TPA: hypothetical protein ENK53_05910 [Thiotrichales bacterium]|nr:hypothetical protein [Thiotrichales bacterium]
METIYPVDALGELDWPWPLTGWYAVPLAPDEARRRLANREPDHAGTDAGLRDQILGFWAEGPQRLHFAPLLATAQGKELALLHLVQGQLLMSVRLAGAMPLLDEGFRAAAPFLDPRDYFTLLRRHELLRRLPLEDRPRTPAGLEALLVEARLRGPRRAFRHRPGDTTG